MSRKQVLLVEWNPGRRIPLALLLEHKTNCDVVQASNPTDVAERELLQPNIDLLITHLRFETKRADQDYAEAAALCRDARRRIGDHLPILGLISATMTLTNLQEKVPESPFPEEGLEIIDLIFEGMPKIVERAKAILSGDSSHGSTEALAPTSERA